MSLSLKVVSLLLPAVLLAGCTTSSSATPTASPAPASVSQTSSPNNVAVISSYTSAQVAAHNSASSCWITINNQIYDVTQYVPNHPGGSQILTGCGQDMSSYMANMHKPVDYLLPSFRIGSLKP